MANSTFLFLANWAGRYIRGTNTDASTTFTTVVGQTGLKGEIVNFVNDAYQDIQRDRKDWPWRITQGTLALSSGNRVIALTTITGSLSTYYEMRPMTAINRAQYILCYNTATGVSDETEVWFIPYWKWRGWFDARTIATGKPQFFTIRPDRGIEFDRTLDANYTIAFDYTRVIHVLAVDADEVYIPPEYDDVIPWGAVLMYCRTRPKAQDLKREAKEAYNQSYGAMTRDPAVPSFSFNRGVFAGWR